MSADRHLIGKCVLVGGVAGVGIPRALALGLADLGAVVVGWDIDEEGGLRLAEEVRRRGGTLDFHCVEGTDWKAIRNIGQEAAQKHGPIAALLCVAGRADRSDHGLLDASDPIMMAQESFHVNVLTAVAALYAVVPLMIEQESGVVVTFDSLNSHRSFGQFFYGTIKACLQSANRINASMYSNLGVRFFNLILGTVVSEKGTWLQRLAENEHLGEGIAGIYGLGEICTPEHVLRQVVDLVLGRYFASGVDIWCAGVVPAAGVVPIVGADWDWRQTTCKMVGSGIVGTGSQNTPGSINRQGGVYSCSVCRQELTLRAGQTFPPCPEKCKSMTWIPFGSGR